MMKSRYSCHSNNHGPAKRISFYDVADRTIVQGTWRIQLVRSHRTDWLDIDCGHITSYEDPECEGCKYRREQA